MILFMDTTDFTAIRFALINDSVTEHVFEIAYNENWKTLDYLQSFLNKSKTNLKSIKKIIVCSGPGSFTGTRVGATIAEAISFSERISIAAIPKNKIPQDLRKLRTVKGLKKIEIVYQASKFD